MSAIGSGVAAGVAQTVLQAQQVAQQRDKQRSQTTADATRLQNIFDAHLHSLEEGDDTNVAQLRIDGQLPERESPQQAPNQSEPDQGVENSTDAQEQDPEAPTDPTNPNSSQLYRHVDVQA